MALADSYTTVDTSPVTQTLGAKTGNREDLRDVLTILEPEATPVTSAIKKGPGPKATIVEVLVDELSDPVVASVDEGVDYGRSGTSVTPNVTDFDNKAAARGRLSNSIHISSRTFGVTDVQGLTDTAGTQGGGEFAYGKAKSVREIKRDIEAVICGNQDKDSTGAGYSTRGLFNWINSGGPSDVHTKYRTPADSIHDGGATSPASAAGEGKLTESKLSGVLQSMFTVRSEKKTYMGVFAPKIVDLVDQFTRTGGDSLDARYMVNDNASTKAINMEVKVFNTSFGTVNIVPSTFLNVTASPYAYDDNAGLLLDMDLLELQFMDPIHTVELDDQGGGRRGYTKAIYSLCMKNPRGFGKILDGDLAAGGDSN
jgi:hypothetical protein